MAAQRPQTSLNSIKTSRLPRKFQHHTNTPLHQTTTSTHLHQTTTSTHHPNPTTQSKKMKTSTILPTLLAVLSTAVPALAADCSGANWGKPDMGLYWTVREVVCGCYNRGESNCNYDNQYVSVQFSGSKPSTQLCWDSTENILNQCTSKGMFMFRPTERFLEKIFLLTYAYVKQAARSVFTSLTAPPSRFRGSRCLPWV